MKAKSADDQKKELERLQGMSAKQAEIRSSTLCICHLGNGTTDTLEYVEYLKFSLGEVRLIRGPGQEGLAAQLAVPVVADHFEFRFVCVKI